MTAAPLDEPARMSSWFAITVPREWFELDVMPASRDASIKSMVYDRTRQVPELRDSRAAIVKLLREFARDAWDAGAVYCASLVEPTSDGPITASLTVTMIDSPSGPDESSGVDRLLDSLGASAAGKGLQRTVTTTTLPGVGEVARTYGVEDVALPDGRNLRCVLMQTFVPLPGGALALVSASSPVLWLEESLLDLFDAVTGTFRVFVVEEGE